MDKTRGYQASIDYLMPIVTHPVMTGEYCRHLRNSIDAMIKFERIQSELERLNAENTKLRVVVDAAKQFMNELDFRGKTHSLDMSNYHGRTIHIKQGESGKPYWLALWSLEQALAELDGKDINVPSKEGE